MALQLGWAADSVLRWGSTSPGSNIILVLQCNGLHPIFLTCRTKSPKRGSAQPLGHRSHYSGHRGRAAMGPTVSRTTGTAPRSLSLPSPRSLLPTGTAWGQPGRCPSHASDLVLRHWTHLTVSEVEASLRVRDKYSYFSCADGEAEAQKSAFCLGPHERPERVLAMQEWHPQPAALFKQVTVPLTPTTHTRWERYSPKHERAVVHPSERQKEPWADQEGKSPLLCRVLVPVSGDAGIRSGTPLGAEDDVQGEAVRTFSAP